MIRAPASKRKAEARYTIIILMARYRDAAGRISIDRTAGSAITGNTVPVYHHPGGGECPWSS